MRWEHFARHTAILYPIHSPIDHQRYWVTASAVQAISNEPRDQPHDHADDYDGECKLQIDPPMPRKTTSRRSPQGYGRAAAPVSITVMVVRRYKVRNSGL